MATAKIIELLLEDGDLDGLLTVQDSSWNGTLFVSPRDSIDNLFSKKETKFWGVYLLLSDDGVYIGQASGLQKRLRQHKKAKDFWNKCVLITTKDDSLNRTGIDYIEDVLIKKAKASRKLHIENKQSGNKNNVSAFDQVRFDNYIANALLLLELIGIDVFKKVQSKTIYKESKKTIVKNNDFYIELSDGFSYKGTSNRDYFLRTIEYLATKYPNTYTELKLNFVSKKGRFYISDKQEYSTGTHAALYSKISNNDFIYTNQSAESLKKNLNQYLNFFDLERLN